MLSHGYQRHNASQLLGGASQRWCDVPMLCGGGRQLLLTST
jgi:hypothetical protein